MAWQAKINIQTKIIQVLFIKRRSIRKSYLAGTFFRNWPNSRKLSETSNHIPEFIDVGTYFRFGGTRRILHNSLFGLGLRKNEQFLLTVYQQGFQKGLP